VLPNGEVVAVACGPALYLLAHVALRLRMTGRIGPRRLIGAVACLGVGVIGTFVPALVLAALLLAVLVGVIVADQVSAHRRQRRGEPSPLERIAATS
jgi:low temperature requirement protein LtrA